MSNEAVVTNVTVKDGAVLVDAYAVGRVSVNYTKIPLLNSFDGLITVPKEGQKVVVTETSNGTSYVEGVLSTKGSSAPALQQEEFALQFDPSTKVTATKDGSGNYTLNIEASGDVTVDAGGSITIGDATNASQLAVQAHTHDYKHTGDTGDGSASTTTKTSTKPNETGTATNVE